MANLEAQRDALFIEWTRKPTKSIKNIENLLESLKLTLSQISFQKDLNSITLVHCRDVLEIGAFFSIETQRIDAFERYLSQLKVYYFDYKDLPESTNKYQLLGLNLMRLLAQNRLADFHTEVELLHPDIIQSNPLINFPVLLEQYLMEGSYNKVFLAKSQVPSPHYTFFVEILLKTVRKEVASEEVNKVYQVEAKQIASQIIEYAVELEKIV